MARGKLAEILKEVNALPGLSAGNVIEQIKTKLQEEDKEIYEEWEKEDFRVDHPFAELIANNYGTTTQNTLLNIAVANNCVNVVNTLIEKKADVNTAPCGWTPLHFAVLNNHIDIVDILIENKADINAKSNGRLTPLLIALENGYASIANTLSEKGADRSDIQLFEQAEENNFSSKQKKTTYKKCNCKRHCCGFCSRSNSCYCTHICYYFIYTNNDWASCRICAYNANYGLERE
jgi:hypothetical protein